MYIYISLPLYTRNQNWSSWGKFSMMRLGFCKGNSGCSSCSSATSLSAASKASAGDAKSFSSWPLVAKICFLQIKYHIISQARIMAYQHQVT